MNITELLQLKKTYQEAIEQHGARLIRELFDEAFAKYPEIEAFRWMQYVPGFNDGEPCSFTRNDLLIKIIGIQEDEEEEPEYEDGFTDEYNIRESHPVISSLMNDLNEKLELLEDALEERWGTGAQVTIYRDRVETDDYDCRY